MHPPGPWAEVQVRGLEWVSAPDVPVHSPLLLQGRHLQKASCAARQVCGLPLALGAEGHMAEGSCWKEHG